MNKNIARIENLVVYFDKTPINNPISFSMNKGQAVSLFGMNAGGKTSILRVLIGNIISYHGYVNIYGIKPIKNRFDILYNSGIRYIPQFPILPYNLKISEYINMLNDNILDRNLFTSLNDLCIDLDKHIKELSFGQKRMIEILVAIYTKPELVIVDEFSSGLSLYNIEYLKEKINSLLYSGTAMISTDHDDKSLSGYYQKIEVMPYEY